MDGVFHSESFVSQFLKSFFFYASQFDLRITESIL